MAASGAALLAQFQTLTLQRSQLRHPLLTAFAGGQAAALLADLLVKAFAAQDRTARAFAPALIRAAAKTSNLLAQRTQHNVQLLCDTGGASQGDLRRFPPKRGARGLILTGRLRRRRPSTALLAPMSEQIASAARRRLTVARRLLLGAGGTPFALRLRLRVQRLGRAGLA